MTGGQPVDGPISVPMISRQVAAEGIDKIVVVTDEPDKYRGMAGMAPGVPVHHRDELDAVMRELRDHAGVSVLIYDQTCATESAGAASAAPIPTRRGACSSTSACARAVAIVRSSPIVSSVEPLETEFGRKRAINQSSCNKDFSCLKGFCPSFVTVEGGKLRKPQPLAPEGAIDDTLPAPAAPGLARPYGVFIAGVGGTGVVTIGQLLGMAAHIEGRGCSVLDMAGLAQKGGAVYSHVVLAAAPDQLMNTRWRWARQTWCWPATWWWPPAPTPWRVCRRDARACCSTAIPPRPPLSSRIPTGPCPARRWPPGGRRVRQGACGHGGCGRAGGGAAG